MRTGHAGWQFGGAGPHRSVPSLGGADMRSPVLVLSLALLKGCVTDWHPAMPNARRYEDNAKARGIYMRAFGEGFKNGWDTVTTDMTPWDLVYKNDDPLLQSAGLDGFNDGERAAWKVRTEEARESLKRKQK
jgi:hypothetical protein